MFTPKQLVNRFTQTSRKYIFGKVKPMVRTKENSLLRDIIISIDEKIVHEKNHNININEIVCTKDVISHRNDQEQSH